jgi:hypothetical protein
MTAPSGPGGPPQVVVPGGGWVDVAARAIATVGFPVVVAGALLWFLLTRFQASMDVITTRMEHNADALERFVTELQAQTVELKAQTRFLGDESKLMVQIAGDASQLVVIRRQELELQQRHGAATPK